MAWIKLHRLLAQLRQRRIDPRDVTVFVDDHIVDPRYRRSIPEDSTTEDDEDLYEGDSEEY